MCIDFYMYVLYFYNICILCKHKYMKSNFVCYRQRTHRTQQICSANGLAECICKCKDLETDINANVSDYYRTHNCNNVTYGNIMLRYVQDWRFIAYLGTYSDALSRGGGVLYIVPAICLFVHFSMAVVLQDILTDSRQPLITQQTPSPKSQTRNGCPA